MDLIGTAGPDKAETHRYARGKSLLSRLIGEPLVHFLILGGLLFLYFEWRGGGAGAGSNRILITGGQIEHLAAGFLKTWQREPSEAELKALIDDFVKEEIAVREATAMGLDREDTIIRRRLRQKLEFLSEELASPAPATDEEIRAWLASHPDSFRGEAKVAFRQVYVNSSRRGASARADAEKILAQLKAMGPRAETGSLGDVTMLPAELPLEPLREAARAFGEEFALQLAKLKPGQWSGPVESSYGLHLVLVREMAPAPPVELKEVRPFVEREVLSERRAKNQQALYEKLLEKYEVRIERPAAKEAGK